MRPRYLFTCAILLMAALCFGMVAALPATMAAVPAFKGGIVLLLAAPIFATLERRL